MSINRFGVGNAAFSEDERYRYLLSRCWDPQKPAMMAIGLNPSTATAERNDPTIRRLIGFATKWGFGGLWMGNIMAFRSTDPAGLPAETHESMGPHNLAALRWMTKTPPTQLVLACWGSHKSGKQPARWVLEMLQRASVQVYCLRVSQDGCPAHPLYLPGHLEPIPFGGRE